MQALRLRALTEAPDEVWRTRAGPDADGVCFVAEAESGAAAGMALGLVLPGLADPLLAGLWVAEEPRRPGGATSLVGQVAGWARSLAATRLTLWVFESSLDARSLFVRLGFMPTGARVVPPPDLDREDDEVRPEIELAPPL